jgi:hypothetical protein
MLNLMIPKKMLEDIWNDKKVRMPLNRTRWLNEPVAGSTQEAPGLYYSKGDRTSTTRRSISSGKSISK